MVVSLTLLLLCACSFAALHILIDTGILVKSLAMIILWCADSSSLLSLFSIINTDHSLHYGLALLHNGSSITAISSLPNSMLCNRYGVLLMEHFVHHAVLLIIRNCCLVDISECMGRSFNPSLHLMA